MTQSNRKVLVTGGAGFIASHVAEAYLAAGDDVWIVDDLSSGRRSNLPAGAEFVEMDVRSPDIRELFREVRFDFVPFVAVREHACVQGEFIVLAVARTE